MRGNRESIKNLLEIFDGLLEYLKEEMSEESQNGGRKIKLAFIIISISYYCHLSNVLMKI